MRSHLQEDFAKDFFQWARDFLTSNPGAGAMKKRRMGFGMEEESGRDAQYYQIKDFQPQMVRMYADGNPRISLFICVNHVHLTQELE